MRHLPPGARRQVEEAHAARERMSEEEYQQYREQKREEKERRKMMDAMPDQMAPIGGDQELRDAVRQLDRYCRRHGLSRVMHERQHYHQKQQPQEAAASSSASGSSSSSSLSGGNSGPWRRRKTRQQQQQSRQAATAEGEGTGGSSGDAGQRMKEWWEEHTASRAFRAMLPQRERLPAFERREEVLNMMREHQVLVVSGETGCGKTTQVPQFILDDAIAKGTGHQCSIICTQPRRISAIGVAERVSNERATRLGGVVGYQIRLERVCSEETRLMYCTTGVLLRRLQVDPQLQGVSHVILDEIHERNIDSDFLIIILRDLVATRPDIRLILMSATLNADTFCTYFGGCPRMHIPGFTFPVDQQFLEHAIEATGYHPPAAGEVSWGGGRGGGGRGGGGRGRGGRRARQDRMRVREIEDNYQDNYAKAREAIPDCHDQTIDTIVRMDDDQIPLELIVELLLHIDRNEEEGAVLIFLPGWDDISKLYDLLKPMPESRHWLILRLHSQVPTSEQRGIFNRPPQGKRKVVISTNIAESSITIDDVVYVIDSGKHKEKSYDASKNIGMLMPAWVSQASATQRKGRAGRVQAGKAWHLFPSYKFHELEEYQQPEMVRTPLDQVCLQVRMLELARPGEGGVQDFLNKALTPPSEMAVNKAVTLLEEIDAFTPEEALTPLGAKLATLPVEPRIGKSLIWACLLGCLDPVLTIVSILSYKSPFNLPMDKKEEADQAKQRLAEPESSDHYAMMQAYYGWREAKRRGDAQRYCWANFLSASSLNMVHEMRDQFHGLLRDARLLDIHVDVNCNSNDWGVVKAALLAGMYPHVARVDRKGRRLAFYTKDTGTISMHPSSVNAKNPGFEFRWLFYFDKVKTPTGLWIYDATDIAPLPLLLFGRGDRYQSTGLVSRLFRTDNDSVVSSDRLCTVLGVSDWVYCRVPNDEIELLELTRGLLDTCLAQALHGWRGPSRGRSHKKQRSAGPSTSTSSSSNSHDDSAAAASTAAGGNTPSAATAVATIVASTSAAADGDGAGDGATGDELEDTQPKADVRVQDLDEHEHDPVEDDEEEDAEVESGERRGDDMDSAPMTQERSSGTAARDDSEEDGEIEGEESMQAIMERFLGAVVDAISRAQRDGPIDVRMDSGSYGRGGGGGDRGYGGGHGGRGRGRGGGGRGRGGGYSHGGGSYGRGGGGYGHRGGGYGSSQYDRRDADGSNRGGRGGGGGWRQNDGWDDADPYSSPAQTHGGGGGSGGHTDAW